MELDPLILSRLQFAFTVSFHILFPAFTIGLAWWIVVLEARWLTTGRDIFFRLSAFWTKIFAISFGLGVVSGIVMTYQFGTNWSRFADITGYVLGPLIQYEVVTAFFLEAAFLGIMLFGRDLVPRGVHFTATMLVAFGTLLSAFWILSANSWMHTPAGYEIREGRFFVTNWSEVVFNPSFRWRFAHMLTASFLTAGFVVAGFSAWYLLKGRHAAHARISFGMALGLIAILAPLQIVLGDLHGLNTLEHQPLKIAAMEGNWDTPSPAPLLLFAIPDQEAERNLFEIGIPYLSSIILGHAPDAVVPVLADYPPEDRPNVLILFWTFRIMVGLAFVMLGVGLISLWLRWRQTLYTARWFHRLCVATTPIGFVALLSGWYTTEIGRQPYMVYGLLRTEDGVTPNLTAGMALTSLVTFVLVYTLIYVAGTYYLFRVLQIGPETPRDELATEAVHEARRPKRPLSSPPEAIESGE